MSRLDRQALAVKTGAVQVQAWDAEPFGNRDRLFRRTDQFVRSIVVGKRAGDVARHGRERGASADQRVDVVLGPVPDLNLKTEAGDAADPLRDRQAAEHHLGTDGKGERFAELGGMI